MVNGKTIQTAVRITNDDQVLAPATTPLVDQILSRAPLIGTVKSNSRLRNIYTADSPYQMGIMIFLSTLGPSIKIISNKQTSATRSSYLVRLTFPVCGKADYVGSSGVYMSAGKDEYALLVEL